MSKYSDDPIEEILGYLQHIAELLESKSATNDTDTSALKDIKKNISDISTSMKAIADSIDDEETREEKRKQTVSEIASALKSDGIPLKPETQKALDIFTYENRNLGEHVNNLSNLSDKISGEHVIDVLDVATDGWLKKHKETLNKNVEDAYKEAERKRRQEGKKFFLSDGQLSGLIFAVGMSICFGVWGMTAVFDRSTLKVVFLGMLAAGIFIVGLIVWMKFQTWRDDRKYKY